MFVFKITSCDFWGILYIIYLFHLFIEKDFDIIISILFYFCHLYYFVTLFCLFYPLPFIVHLTSLISSLPVLMMVHLNRNAAVSTLCLYKSRLLLGLPCYQFFFPILTNFTLFSLSLSLSFSLSHSLTQTHTHTHTHTLSLSLSLSLSHRLTHTHTHTHTLSLSLSLSLSRRHTHTLYLSHSHSLSHTDSHTHTHSLSHFLSLSYTHIHSSPLPLPLSVYIYIYKRSVLYKEQRFIGTERTK